MKKKKVKLYAEWAEQDIVQLTWPHKNSDWAPMLEEAEACFVEIARAITRFQDILIVCADTGTVKDRLKDIDPAKLRFVELPGNDTWTRDHGGISVSEEGKPVVCDFTFNGWGLKFAADKDNRITRRLFESGNVFAKNVNYRNHLDFVLEGGSLETDGEGTLLTTAECLLSPNRNDNLSKEKIEKELSERLGISRFLWLNHGYLRGDDTDSHIDTLARFCDARTIAYVKCEDKNDEHYRELKKMEAELESFRTANGEPYRLIALPMADKVVFEGERLPATYANFVIMNGAVLVPFYGSPKDAVAAGQLKAAFPDRQIVGINCLPLIKQHGSLHCVTMQYPKGFMLTGF